MNAALIVLNAEGLTLARRLQPRIPGARIHGFAGRADNADLVFTDTMAHLRSLFREGVPIIGICASGILIRALGPLLDNKHRESAVVALDEDGSVIVPLIGGHHGANALARRIAGITGGVPAITTAGDRRFGFALDEPPPGWRVANPEMAKPVMAALLSGAGARLDGVTPWLAGAPWRDDAALGVCVTERAGCENDHTLVLHPPVLTVGVGCERGTDPAELAALIARSLAETGLAAGAVAAIGSLDLKMDEPAMHHAAAALNTPLRYFSAAELEAEAPRLRNPSDIVFQETGCHGVAEGAALALAGPDGELVVAKRKSKRATCAIARAAMPLEGEPAGRPRGALSVVGIGPGSDAWRSPEATALIAQADIVVGYGLYIDLLGALVPVAKRRDYGLGAETARVREALSQAAEGQRVALVCSGDAGIYALATLVYEMLDATDDPAWRRIAICVAPGISAMQAAAARAGAPLGHDFCAVSLSDLLTPRGAIIARLEAAAAGDFVTALYNPQSNSRRDLLVRARDIFAAARPPSTPVTVARNLGRPDETVAVVPLSDLDIESIDMLTILIIGNSESRMLDTGDGMRMYTPRGYRGKI
ncbi:MAG: precorrin-3B C(17)-methyltransferase [Alphaproteobacteria bacterium]